MKTTLGVALTPPTAAALIAGACLLAAAFLPSRPARDLPRSAAVASTQPCRAARANRPAASAHARRADDYPFDEAAEAAQAARRPAAAAAAGHAASGQR
ncbi:hypothetical protein [Lysobacter enzymogenes]|uniref:hypothetical protein n=1 Tax=Lysobacter enzymogenes TaxID=69 RepID=UPI001A95D827|nr:hypothetical protein [Lysobacter enzymogenes]QQP97756.1 hypothetical protein JHW38_07025 [Lysobacter enzymogenes]